MNGKIQAHCWPSGRYSLNEQMNSIYFTNISNGLISLIFLFADEKKKTKKVDNELNPIWNEVTSLLFQICFTG